MKIKDCFRSIFLSRWQEKLIILFFQIFLLIEYCMSFPIKYGQNIFNTYAATDLNFIFMNLDWIAYYFCGEFYLLGTLQNKLLATNPLMVIRNPKRTMIFRTIITTSALFSALYNLFFTGLLFGLKAGHIDLLFLLQLFMTLWLSFFTFTLFLLLISIIGGVAITRIFAILISLFSLGLKTNMLTMVTTTDWSTATWSNLIWSVCLFILVYVLNQKIEIK